MSTDERIVVGVSGSASSTAALRWAAAAARLRGAEILAVHACAEVVDDAEASPSCRRFYRFGDALAEMRR